MPVFWEGFLWGAGAMILLYLLFKCGAYILELIGDIFDGF